MAGAGELTLAGRASVARGAAPDRPPDGGTLLHLDLHPDNVLLSPSGPVVADWTNAARGDAGLDLALTWVLLSTSGGRPGPLAAAPFRRHVDRRALVRALPEAVAYRCTDRNVTEAERRRLRRLDR